MYIGAFFVLKEGTKDSVPFTLFFAPLSLLPRIAFVFNFVYRIWIELLIMAYQKNKRVFRIMTCNKIDRKWFFDKYNTKADPLEYQDEDE